MNTTGSIRTAMMRHSQAITEASGAVVPLGHGSRAESAPVTHYRYKPVGLDAPECGHHGAARHAVFTGQLCHRGQPLLRLPFTRADSRT
jgi:hypothetical protein